MPDVVVRDLPESVCTALHRRAEARGQSLQQYLVVELTRLAAEHPTTEELFTRIERRRGGEIQPHLAVADLDTDRNRRLNERTAPDT